MGWEYSIKELPVIKKSIYLIIQLFSSIRGWYQVPMSKACIDALGKLEDGFIADWARENCKGQEKILSFIATYIATNAQVTAVRPPSKKRGTLPPEELARGHFTDSGDTFSYYGTNQPKYAEIAITRIELCKAVKKIKKQEKIFRQ